MTAYMALPSVLHRFDLSLAQVDRGVDRAIQISLARHPSETVERLWLRVLAYCWQWQEGIAFGPGLCEPEAPDVLAPGPHGLSLVVRVGAPGADRVERDVRQNAGARVAVLFESPRRLRAFADELVEGRFARARRAEVAAVEPAVLGALAGLEARRFAGSVTFVEDHVYLDVGGQTVDGPLHRIGTTGD